MQLRKAVGACVLGVALSVGSVPAGAQSTHDIILSQGCLQQLGFYRGTITGVMDEGTTNAFLAYVIQRYGLKEVRRMDTLPLAAQQAYGRQIGVKMAAECLTDAPPPVKVPATFFDDLEQSKNPAPRSWWPFYTR